MILKEELFRLTRIHLDLTQSELAVKLKYNNKQKICDIEKGRKKLTYPRLCQLYVLYCKKGKQCEQLENIFNNYIEKMFKED